ncbi:MAG: hypothetical protein IPM56_03495 [Ignavibacteriales bacterium]|nr:MAG: hypothetical protein IPM56_03495 [Ignavibacteriales bacterium]
MRILSFLIILVLAEAIVFAQSPHGDGLDIDCSDCHESTSWKIVPEKLSFDHSTTGFELVGQHKSNDCRSCHSTLVFSEAKPDCFSCHKDIHQGTTGFDCARCHTPQSWIVKDINFLHQASRFPLVGSHQTADCNSCHTEYHSLNFRPLGITCFDCHFSDYNSATAPNHLAAGFATTCEDCHSITATEWSQTDFAHDFFPLVQGHAIADCFSCHTAGSNFQGLNQDCYSCHRSDYEGVQDPNHISANFPTTCTNCHTIAGWSPTSFDHNQTQFALTGAHVNVNCSSCHSSGFSNTPTDCYSCHQTDYTSAANPNHIAANFPTTCVSCHSTSAWIPATFEHDAQYFPIYSGEHRNEWNNCSDCHTNPNNFAEFSCITCHEHNQNEMDDKHSSVAGYVYQSEACLSCHPDGSKANAFNHQLSNFPLTGSHLAVNCSDCHTSGYTGTSTICVDCHQSDFNSTANPNHTSLSISTDCVSCHTTDPDWQPATFALHNNYYQLIGAHNTIANQCASCHNGNYTTTPNTCYECHTTDYNNTTNPPHASTGFSTDCMTCHSQNAWQPATFDHDAQYFPIYSGEHRNEWNSCSDCHTVPSNYAVFSCIDCHEHNQNDMDDEHQGVSGYVYASAQCLACHPDGSAEGAFNHLQSNFPLTGSHISVNCESCHSSGYTGTSTICVDCHQTNYSASTNPNHQQLGISTDCASCHSTNPDWQPASFAQHNQYFELTGRHSEIANDCSTCHNGNYTTTPDQCFGCHQQQFNIEHQNAGLPTLCEQCHTTTAWIPSTFNHALTGFELTGTHNQLQCSGCHEGTTTGLNSACISCHQSNYNSAPNHLSQNYPTNCELCHNSVAWNQTSFNHQQTNFPLTGAHTSTNCIDCHESGYTGTSTICNDCHNANYVQATNPSHTALSLSTECQTCHTTNPDWQPATFSVHNNYYQLVGAHALISNNCVTCHNGNYNNTPNTCYGCHQAEFTATTDPPHQVLNFSHDCLTCHNQNNWNQGSFNHSFYPISNDHNNVSCGQCHSQPNYQPQCISCHLDDFLDEHEIGDPTNCWDCHSTFNWDNDNAGKIRRFDSR